MTPEKENEILAAFDNLYATLGRNPTYQEVLKELGGGSNTQVKAARDKWLARQEQQNLAALEMPESVNRAVVQATNRIWFETRSLINSQIEAVKNDAASKITALELDNDYFLNQTVLLEEKLSLSAHQQAELKIQLERSLAKSDSLAAEISDLKIRVAVQAKDIERLEKDNAELREQRRQLLIKTKKVDQ